MKSSNHIPEHHESSEHMLREFVIDFEQAWERAHCDKAGEPPLVFKVKWYQELKAQAELLDADPVLLQELSPDQLNILNEVVDKLGELPEKMARKNSRYPASYYRKKALKALELLQRKSQHHDDDLHITGKKTQKHSKEEQVTELLEKLQLMYTNVLGRIEAYSKALEHEELQQEQVVHADDPDSISNTRRLSTAITKINRYEMKLLELGQIHNDLQDCIAHVSAKKATWKDINAAIKTLHGRWVGQRRAALFHDPELFLLLEDVIQENKLYMDGT